MINASVRALGALASAAAVAGAALVAAQPAGALDATIRKPTLTVICSEPHHGPHYTAARFTQSGQAAAGGKVKATISAPNSTYARAVMRTQTAADGSFHLRRTLYSQDAGPWVVGATYTWTTYVHGGSWGMARRGSVTLTGSC